MPRRRRKSPRPRPAASKARREWELPLAHLLVAVLLFAVSLLVLPGGRDTFSLPKLMAAELLALASLVPLAWRLRSLPTVAPSTLWRRPALLAVLPLVLVATAGLPFTDHPHAVRQGLADLWIGAAALAGWSLGLPRGRLRRLLGLLPVPAALLALLAVLQFHDLYRPFGFTAGEEATRLGVGALAGNPGALAGLLALAVVAAQAELLRRTGRRRVLAGVMLALLLYGLAATQTLGGIAAAAAGSLVFWGRTLPRRRLWQVLAAGAAAAVLLLVLVAPLRERLERVSAAAGQGQWNALLSGRLDGWSVALGMTAEHPLTGVGHGAYGASYGETKLAMAEAGHEFHPSLATAVFGNAHQEWLEVAAETGLPGLLALLFGVGVLVGCAMRVREAVRESSPVVSAALTGGASRTSGGHPRTAAPSGDPGLAWGLLATLLVLSLVHFPFRLAVTGYPAILALAWIFAAGGRRPGEGDE